MGDTTVWGYVKDITSFLWIPIGLYMNYIRQQNERKYNKDMEIDDRLTVVEQQSKLNDMQINSIKEALRDTKDSIKEVKQGVDKLVDRLLK